MEFKAKFTLSILIIALSVANVLPLPVSHTELSHNKPICSRIVDIETFGVLNYLGTVSFRVPADFNGRWKLDMTTNVPFTFLGGWGVTLNVDAENGRAEFHSKNNVQLKAGDRITFRFRISFGKERVVPYVQELKWEGYQICEPKTTLAATVSEIAPFTSQLDESTESFMGDDAVIKCRNCKNTRRRSLRKLNTPKEADVPQVVSQTLRSFSLFPFFL